MLTSAAFAEGLSGWPVDGQLVTTTYSSDDSSSEAPSISWPAPNSSRQPHPTCGGPKRNRSAVPRLFHFQLNRQVGFVHYPKESYSITAPSRMPDCCQYLPSLFFGQVKFDIPVALLWWVIAVLTNERILPLALHSRGAGCFMVYFSCEADAALMMQYTESVLFDDCGMWVARTVTERAILRQHAAEMGPTLQGIRLPKGCMVIRP